MWYCASFFLQLLLAQKRHSWSLRVRDVPLPSEYCHKSSDSACVTAGHETAIACHSYDCTAGCGIDSRGRCAVVQACPVSPRVIWRNVAAQHVASHVLGVPPTVPWLEWLLDHYARTCWGLPAALHVAVDLALIFHARIWAQLLHLRSSEWTSEPRAKSL